MFWIIKSVNNNKKLNLLKLKSIIKSIINIKNHEKKNEKWSISNFIF
jgi:hypothetical protein